MNSGIYRFYKRLTAMLLAICMIAGLVMGQPNILSYASTELQNEDLVVKGSRLHISGCPEGRKMGTHKSPKIDKHAQK